MPGWFHGVSQRFDLLSCCFRRESSSVRLGCFVDAVNRKVHSFCGYVDRSPLIIRMPSTRTTPNSVDSNVRAKAAILGTGVKASIAVIS